jgi:hypothetical protein
MRIKKKIVGFKSGRITYLNFWNLLQSSSAESTTSRGKKSIEETKRTAIKGAHCHISTIEIAKNAGMGEAKNAMGGI